MSELYLTDTETKGFPQKGDTDFLSPAETAFVQRVLRRPEVFPQEFWKAVIQKVALDGEPVPQSQIIGLGTTVPAKVLSYVSDTVDVVSTTSETALFSFEVQGGTLGPRGSLSLELFGDILKNTSASLTVSVKFGGTTHISHAGYVLVNSASRRPYTMEVWVANKGGEAVNDIWARSKMVTTAATTGIGGILDSDDAAGSGWDSIGAGGVVSTIDTSTDQTLEVTVKWTASSSSASFRCRNAKLVYYPAPRIAA